jgi:ribosomal protein S18 acetylase RimI-like enzyme
MPGSRKIPGTSIEIRHAVIPEPAMNEPKPLVKDFCCFSEDDLHALFVDVYSSSDAMSEVLEDKYPDSQSLVRDVATIENLPGAVTLAADIDHKPVAYVIVKPRSQARLRHTADLSIGVARGARGRGLGQLVLRIALDRVRAASVIEIVYLMVRSDNAPAIRLYESAGFETVAVLDRDTRIGDAYFDGILMRKRIRA